MMTPKKNEVEAANKSVEDLARMMQETDEQWLLELGWKDYDTAHELLKHIGMGDRKAA